MIITKWILRGSFPGAKWLECEADKSLPSNADVKSHSAMCLRSLHKENFTCLISAIRIPHHKRLHKAQKANNLNKVQ